MYEKGEQNIKNPHYGNKPGYEQKPYRSLYDPQVYPPPLRDDAIMIAALERIERKLDLLLGKLSDGKSK